MAMGMMGFGSRKTMRPLIDEVDRDFVPAECV